MRDQYVSIRTSEKIKDALEKAARDDDRTVSQFVERILIAWLREHGHIK